MAFGFGAPAAPAAPSAFGSFGTSPAAAPAAPAAGGFSFAQPGAAQPAAGTAGATGGLFGSSQPASQPAATGGLFGSTPAASASTSSLFGAKPATGGSLFGGQQQQTQPATGGLFGSTSAQPAQTSSLFGAQQQQPAQQTSSLFGSTTAQPATSSIFGAQAAAPTGGLFGQQQQQQQPASSIFGAQQQPAQTTSLFGQPAAAQASNPLQASTTAGPSSGISKTTKFSDLPDPVQKTIEQMDAWIKDQKQVGASIDTENIGRAIWQTSGDVKAASDAAIAQGLHSLKATLEQLAEKVSSEAQDLQKLLETWEAAKPADARHGAVRPVPHRDFPQEYFGRVAQGLEERVNRYKRTITLLTRAVTSVANDNETLNPQVVAQTIQNNQQALISLAAQLEGLQLRMNALRTNFTEDYRERTNSMRDPFEVAREEKGISLLRA
ncbi:uncharacterized protein EHS24_003210 [Apiotrichum porosum]|uniref:Nucleoporin Nup54 alpha-helical domain-containing protein n=1 Tax=Apiotrichum porosum TaxID=105984 RepID=A0A427XFI3_9TREE|nr:uncharacterized protein EHS24_003210 [Apiotrichum porosum]RSH77649.1 hypothetical protein EHS24_003210 [Apiotrichum porosum]